MDNFIPDSEVESKLKNHLNYSFDSHERCKKNIAILDLGSETMIRTPENEELETLLAFQDVWFFMMWFVIVENLISLSNLAMILLWYSSIKTVKYDQPRHTHTSHVIVTSQ